MGTVLSSDSGLAEQFDPMDPIRSFCGKLRSLASTLDSETSRLQRALDGEESGEGSRRSLGGFRRQWDLRGRQEGGSEGFAE